MSNIRVNTINDASGGSAAVLYGVASPPNSMGFRNRILNGGMVIDQRNAGAAVTPASSAYLVDRYQAVLSVGSKLTFQQVSDAPAGFSNSFKVTVASQYNPSTSEQFVVRQAIEGFNIADFNLGTASATTITVSAWVKSSVAGTYALYLANGASNRGYVSTVSVTTSWTQVSFTLTGDTAGTWLTNNGIGLYLGIDLGCGATFKAPSNNSWQAGDYKSATGAVVFVNQAVAATFQITGVQLEAGTVASPFERRDYGRELMMCQRYYSKSYDIDTAVGTNTGYDQADVSTGNTGSTGYYQVGKRRFAVTMRSTPTISLWSYDGIASNWHAGVAGVSQTQYSASTNFVSSSGLGIQMTGVNTTYNTSYGHWAASAEL